MYLESITVCVGYDDFLEETLPNNLQHIDHMVVVTSPEDKPTQWLCQKHGVTCVQTDVFYDWGDKFNKGRGIELGKAYCRNKDWLIQLDADMYLPHKFRSMLNMHPLEHDVIYGADRLGTKSHENWMKHKHYLTPQHTDGCHVWAHPQLPLHSRLIHGQHGYVPIGFFQMWHASQRKTYPISQGSCEHTDLLFGLQWPKLKRKLIPELFLYHLESEQAVQGANWDGRKTRFFGPKEKEEAWLKRNQQHALGRHHHHHHHKPYYK